LIRVSIDVNLTKGVKDEWNGLVVTVKFALKIA
jgi:hypothetical protein